MPRPRRCRRVGGSPKTVLFKPAGVVASRLEEVQMSIDELEALRLADLEGLYQEQAASSMDVSRQTFGRIVEAARRKVASALVKGAAIRIEGGDIKMADNRSFKCGDCNHEWQLPFGTGRPEGCPECGGTDSRREREGEGRGRMKGQRCGGGRRRRESGCRRGRR